ncbi:hypothetical protein AGABI1DRAFT_93233 [Agaricus bisporus var. burnettii JB137-S8]|uniref:Uncharacterized protein n=1 Tax=Agaricus bisporus var. burnettii (strain JB137-S8 / ATCC MYA-4627 / FGSC 10392) TaxID=597362 RepID=K5X3I5_AGABU|nr:uncharacterized protein AGABI1DRAFT_93233 [Agaricus bisporus var. burnettii JB137-S8]EKM77492.1 hypothetical protein AGABI1DRAFT_93233 [Agaricus bisporus var. burnettii JB137-S8]
MFRITQLLPSCEKYLEPINKPFVIELEYILVAQHNWLKPKSLTILLLVVGYRMRAYIQSEVNCTEERGMEDRDIRTGGEVGVNMPDPGALGRIAGPVFPAPGLLRPDSAI